MLIIIIRRARNGSLMQILDLLTAKFTIMITYLVDMFKPDVLTASYEESKTLAIFMVRLAAVYVTIEAIMVVYSGALRGAGDTFWVMCVMVVLNWTTTITLWLTTYVFDLGPKIGWLSVVILFISFPIVLYWRFKSRKWKKAKI